MSGMNIQSTQDVVVPAGAFNRRVTFQIPSDTPDGQGGQTRVWVTSFSTWAHMEMWKGRELWQGQQVYPSMYMRVLLRYRPSMNISPAMRMLYKTRMYNIRSVGNPAEAETTIELLCEQLQATGSI